VFWKQIQPTGTERKKDSKAARLETAKWQVKTVGTGQSAPRSDAERLQPCDVHARVSHFTAAQSVLVIKTPSGCSQFGTGRLVFFVSNAFNYSAIWSTSTRSSNC
jgi:hypothetical protein